MRNDKYFLEKVGVEAYTDAFFDYLNGKGVAIGEKRRAPCPWHNGKDKNLAFFEGEYGEPLVCCHSQCAKPENQNVFGFEDAIKLFEGCGDGDALVFLAGLLDVDPPFYKKRKARLGERRKRRRRGKRGLSYKVTINIKV